MDALAGTDIAIRRDILCRSCGYNVRGLVASGACPECAAPIRDSLRPDDLAFADKSWLGQVSAGLWISLLGLWLTFGTSAVLFFESLARPARTFALIPSPGMIIAVGAAVFVFLSGIFICTGRESRFESSVRKRRARRLTRLLAVLIAALTILLVVLTYQQKFRQLLPATRLAIGLAAAGLSVTFPHWLDQLIQRASVGTPEASATVASWLALTGSVFLVWVLVVGWIGWWTGVGIAMMALLPVSIAYIGVLHLAIFRSAAAVAYDNRPASGTTQ